MITKGTQITMNISGKKKELYIGSDRETFNRICSLLADAGISFHHKTEDTSVNASPVRGYSIGIAGRAPAGTTLYCIYVSAKDYETASALLCNGKKNM